MTHYGRQLNLIMDCRECDTDMYQDDCALAALTFGQAKPKAPFASYFLFLFWHSASRDDCTQVDRK